MKNFHNIHCQFFRKFSFLITAVFWLMTIFLSQLQAAAVVDTISTVSITNISADNFPEISVTMSVIDHFKNTIPGLGNLNFEITEDLVPEDAIVASKLTRVGVIDIVVVFDTTVSMRDQIASLKDKITDFADSLTAHKIDYNFGIVSYGDSCRAFNNGNLTGDVTEFQSWIANLKAAGGGSIKENTFAAMLTAANMKFRSNAQKIILLITDAPAWSAGDAGSPTNLTLAVTVDSLNAAKITCHAVAPKMTEYNGTNGLANGTGGIFYDIDKVNFDLIVDRVISIITGQYVLTYYTHNKWADGTRRTVRGDVFVADDSGWDQDFYRAPNYSTILYLTTNKPTPKVGTGFTIEVNVGRNPFLAAKNIYGVSYCVEYDPQKVNYLGSSGGNFLIADTLYREWADPVNGRVCFSVTRKFPPGENGSGILRTLNFSSPKGLPNNTVVAFKLAQTAAYAPRWVQIPLQTEDLTITLRDTVFYQVWPGDTDNNGRVNEADILPVGFYYGETGYPRENATTDWQAQTCVAWTNQPATFADATGDGEVNWDEVAAVEKNWGEIHGFRNNRVRSLASATINGDWKIEQIAQISGEEYAVQFMLTAPPGITGIAFKMQLPDGVSKINRIEIPDCYAPGLFQHIFKAPNQKLTSVALVVPENQSKITKPFSTFKLNFRTEKGFAENQLNFLQIINPVVINQKGQVCQIARNSSVQSSLVEIDLPTSCRLFQNYPNPFNATTKIRFQLPEEKHVTVEIVDVTGSLVACLSAENHPAGEYEITWNGKNQAGHNVSSGIYFYRMKSGKMVKTRKLILIR